MLKEPMNSGMFSQLKSLWLEVEVYQVGQTSQRWIDLTLKSISAKVQLDNMASLLATSDTAPVAAILTSP
jgi:hypothetical protein